MRNPFPLQWPDGWSRTTPRNREPSRFVTGMARAAKDCLHELALLGAANVVITSDFPTRASGVPYGDTNSGLDSGIAVWFVLGNEERVLACDRWSRAAENIHAIGLTVGAMRGIARWGANDIVARAFSGFKALPPAPPETRPWWTVLCVQRDVLELPLVTLAKARRAHRLLLRVAHPDMPHGDGAVAAAINSAFDDATTELEALEAARQRELEAKEPVVPAGGVG